MDIVLIILLLAAIFGLPVIILNGRKRSAPISGPMPEKYREILKTKVDFYIHLDEAKQKEFEDRTQHFLATTKITGVRTDVEDVDRVLIAAGAIIPIFGFAEWEYVNLNEVLLYPEHFDESFAQEGNDRNILGMVGEGALEDVMVLSKHSLREGFENRSGKGNTAIHEFVHLIDKTDGDVDGIPEYLVSNRLMTPWLEKIHETIKKIVEDRTDINPYGASNHAEFFAVVSEYFFKRPDLLESKHHELYEILVSIFKQKPKLKE